MCEKAYRNAQQSCWMQFGWSVTCKVSNVDVLASYFLCCLKANMFSFQIDAFTFRRYIFKYWPLLSHSLSVVFTSRLQCLRFRLVFEAQYKSMLLPTSLAEDFRNSLILCLEVFREICVFVFVIYWTTKPWFRLNGMNWRCGKWTVSWEKLRRDFSWHYP